MSGTKLTPENITSPFQLMAAWFSMLVLLVSVLLTASVNITEPSWAAGYLVIASSLVILIVIGCVITMLTKFRPHLQEGKEYAEWLKEHGSYSKGIIDYKSVGSITRIETESSINTAPIIPFEGKGKDETLISLVNMFDATSLAETLKNQGFQVEIYEDDNSVYTNYEEQECIWIGERVSPRVVIPAIKLAINIWPHLKYLELSSAGDVEPPDYIHDQVFLGGSTKTAKQRKLKAWRNIELASLNENTSLIAFHELIEAKNKAR